MIDLVKKSMLTGIGIASITKEKIEEVAKDLMKQGTVTEQEGKKFVEEMMVYVNKTRSDIEQYIDKNIEKALNKLDLAKKSDLEELKTLLADLQNKLDKE